MLLFYFAGRVRKVAVLRYSKRFNTWRHPSRTRFSRPMKFVRQNLLDFFLGPFSAAVGQREVFVLRGSGSRSIPWKGLISPATQLWTKARARLLQTSSRVLDTIYELMSRLIDLKRIFQGLSRGSRWEDPHVSPCHCYSTNSFSYRGSYFKLGGEGLQILWVRCGMGCHTGCHWRCNLLMCVRAGVRNMFFYKFRFLLGYILYPYLDLFLAKYFHGRRCIFWIGLYLSMLFGVYAGIYFLGRTETKKKVGQIGVVVGRFRRISDWATRSTGLAWRL